MNYYLFFTNMFQNVEDKGITYNSFLKSKFNLIIKIVKEII